MHTFWQRANALLTYAGTVLAVMCIATTITDYFHVAHPVVDVRFEGVEGLTNDRRHDKAHIVLDLTADLRSVFSWNTKQLFVYVNIDFATPKNPESHMVMWSTLVVRKDDALLVKPHLRASYPYAVTDQGSNLRGRGFNVTVAWNVMPRVGALYTDSETFSGFTLPSQYLELEKGNVRTGEEEEQYEDDDDDGPLLIDEDEQVDGEEVELDEE